MDMAAILGMWPGPFEQTFVLNSQGGSTWHLAQIGLAAIKEKKILTLSDLDQCEWMTLTFVTHEASCTHLVDLICQLL